ncbi:MAG: HAMP domain-containing protein [Chlamydiae bacterium]|nr:HAMP domain-containing protein [Chlamydiota bacterium]MBI3276852.1 HAMP domain-containing protein [Chlamydiota bacterium]
MKISLKIIISVVLALVIVMAIGAYLMSQSQARFFTHQMKQEADIIADALEHTLVKVSTDDFRNKEYMQQITEELGKTVGVGQIEVYDLNKVVIADTDREEIGEETTGEDAADVMKVIETGEPVTGTEMKEGKEVYTKCFPIYVEKELVGVAEVTMDLEAIEKELTIKEQAEILSTIVQLNLQKIMADKNNNASYLQMLTENLGKQAGVDQVEIYDTTRKIIADTDRDELGTIAGYEDVKEVLETGKSYAGFEIMEGKEVYSKTLPIYTKSGQKEEISVVEVAMSVPYIQGLIASARNGIILLAVFIVLAISVLIIFLLRKSVISPILNLAGVTRMIAGGDLTKRAEVKAKDEIGDLAFSFNQMTDEIQKRNEELQTMNEELRQTNEELETSNEELQQTTEELETSNEELRTTQEELVQKEKLAAVGQLAAGVGHELRNPLGVIKNAVYYIKSKVGEEDPKLAKHLGIVEREIANSNKIISDLLGFSRTRKPELIPIDVNEVVEESIAVANVQENVKVIKNLLPSLPKSSADRDQLRQVFLNIILNACQAMPQGGELKISSRLNKAGLKGKDCLEIEFADAGTGIAPEDIKKLFDPFFTTKAKGIGLGLAVSKGIIEKHEGDIEVKSELHKGTTFIVKLGV